jgi:threonine-phosphate decarboxylase
LVAEEREFLLGELAAMPGLHPFPSRACFVLVRLDTPGLTAPLLKQRLLEHHILIRDASNFRGLDSRYVRFAVKAHEDNARLLEALKQVLAAVAAGGPP